MKIFKHIKTGHLYTIQTLSNVKDLEKSYNGIQHNAIPCEKNVPVLINIDIKEFVPYNSERNKNG